MNFLSIIEQKRDGKRLEEGTIREMVAAYTNGSIPDYQMAAFLMAVYFKGLDSSETRVLTSAMRDSGDVLDFPSDPRPLVDKHSTGGVGDKISLPLAPLLACLGFRVPMISGRGLGITGGTLDKLDSIPGFRTQLSRDEIVRIVQTTGCVICGQTERMVPADKALYALRDVTGTVPSIPLIVASIMSKKLAEGLAALVLDVKFGKAAFMPDREQAQNLAEAMVSLGVRCGVKTSALITSMDTPLGKAAGNWLEVKESVECLSGYGPGDVMELVLACAAQLLVQTGRAASAADGRTVAAECLKTGKPMEKWNEMISAQGARMGEFRDKLLLDSTAQTVTEIRALSAGFLSRCDARLIGEIIRDLGGGRLTRDSILRPGVGVDRLAKPGEKMSSGSLLARVHADSQSEAEKAAIRLKEAFEIQNEPPPRSDLLAGSIG